MDMLSKMNLSIVYIMTSSPLNGITACLTYQTRVWYHCVLLFRDDK